MPSEAQEAKTSAAISQLFGDGSKGATNRDQARPPAKTPATPTPKPGAARAAGGASARAPVAPARPVVDTPPDDTPDPEQGDPPADDANGAPADGDADPDAAGGSGIPKHVQLLLAGKPVAALKEAFGEHFKDLEWLKADDKRFAAQNRRDKAFDEKVAEAKTNIQKDIDALKGAEGELASKWGSFKEFLDGIEVKISDGSTALANVSTVELIDAVARHAGIKPNQGESAGETLVRAYVKGHKELPREARERLRRLEERGRQQPQQQAPQGQPQSQQRPQGQPSTEAVQAAVASAVADCKESLKGHDVARIKDYGAKVWEAIKGEFQKTGKKLTLEQAAARVIENRRKEIEEDQWLLDGGDPAPVPENAPRQSKPLPRPQRQLRGAAPRQDNLTHQQRREDAITRVFGGG